MSSLNERPTLLRPPEPDPKKAPIENVLEVTELAALGPVSFYHGGVMNWGVGEMR